MRSTADPQHDPAEDVSPLNPGVRPRRRWERIDRGDRHLELCRDQVAGGDRAPWR